MCKEVVLGTLTVFIFTLLACHQPVTGYPAIISGDESGPMNVVIDPEEYEDYASPPGVLMKRFFTNHPSDYNAMRRPGPLPRGSKRDDGIPFHPLPRSVSASLRHGGRGSGEFGLESDGYIESGRQKKQTRAATLIFRLGSLGFRRKPTVPPGPTV